MSDEVEVTVVCPHCGYSEQRRRKKDESYEGTKCPNCDEPMNEVEEE